MIDLQSIIIYLGLAIVSFALAKFAELTNKKSVVWLIVILLSLIAGFRSTSVGIDTISYDNIFNLISSENVNLIYGVEKSFIYICSIILNIWNNNNFLFFIFALVSHGLAIFRIWKDRNYISFRWSIFSYYILFFPFSLNGMRQFVAVAIVFYATSFVKDGKYVKFIVAILVASLFHSSAIISLAYLFFEIIFSKYFNAKRKLVVYLLVSIGVVMSFSIVIGLLNRYARFFDARSSSIGFMMIIKIVLLLVSIIIMQKPFNKDELYYYSSHRLNYSVGLLLNSLSYVFLYMGRIGLYFYVFETIYIGYLFKTKNRTKWILLFKSIYAMLLLYYLYDNIAHGAHGEIPYRFFWQN